MWSVGLQEQRRIPTPEYYTYPSPEIVSLIFGPDQDEFG
jgi:hypothetical protein